MASKDGPETKSTEKKTGQCIECRSIHSKLHSPVNYIDGETVLDALKEDHVFKAEINEKAKKEFVILMERRAISSHFPCSLITKKLTLKFLNGPKRTETLNPRPENKNSVVFHVETVGHTGIVFLMKNNDLAQALSEVTVYGYIGETIEQALKRDGRFEGIFDDKKPCALIDINSNWSLALSENVEETLGDKTFYIILVKNIKMISNTPREKEESVKEHTGKDLNQNLQISISLHIGVE